MYLRDNTRAGYGMSLVLEAQAMELAFSDVLTATGNKSVVSGRSHTDMSHRSEAELPSPRWGWGIAVDECLGRPLRGVGLVFEMGWCAVQLRRDAVRCNPKDRVRQNNNGDRHCKGAQASAKMESVPAGFCFIVLLDARKDRSAE
jgi:hypothetical protein